MADVNTGTNPSICEHCGQAIPRGTEWKSRNYRRGLLIAFLTFIPYAVGFASAFRSISAARTTGLGAVAGGISEIGVTFGLGALIVFAVGGIVLLVRGFSPGRGARSIVSVLGIAWCGYVLLSTATMFALMVILARQHP